MKKAVFILLLCALCARADDIEPIGTGFPLWGSSWVIADEVNKRIYPSVLPLQPKRLAVLRFDGVNNRILFKKMKFTDRDWACTADIYTAIQDSINNSPWIQAYPKLPARGTQDLQVMHVQYKIFDDTVWSIHPLIIDSLLTGNWTGAGIIQNGVEKDYNSSQIDALRAEMATDSAWTMEKPRGYLSRPATPQEKSQFTLDVFDDDLGRDLFYRQANQDNFSVPSGLNDGSNVKITGGMQEQDDDAIEYIDQGNYVTFISKTKDNPKTGNLGYWQCHFHPEAWYFVRDPQTGTPIISDSCPDCKMGPVRARALKGQSIDSPNDFNLKYYRNPYLSDSCSFIISFAFVDDGGTALKNRPYIFLSGAEAGSKVSYNHMPSRMVRVEDDQNTGSIMQAVLQLYERTDDDMAFAKSEWTRCPDWTSVDKQNSTYLYPLNLRSNGTISRDWTQADGIFTYNGCPCTKEASLGGLTKIQLRRFIYYPVPTCSWFRMARAQKFYEMVQPFLTAPKDQAIVKSRIEQVNYLLQNRLRLYNKANMNINAQANHEQRECPDDWTTEIQSIVR